MLRLFAIVLTWLFVFWPGSAMAWGNAGHMTVCEIAYSRLTPATRTEVDRLLPLFRRYQSFAESCTYPDNPPILGARHYINYPRSLAMVTDDNCGTEPQGICILLALRENLAVLERRAGDQTARAQALYLVGHWVGDIHQPLHASFEDDRGGGGVSVRGRPCVWTSSSRGIRRDFDNLHKVWDRCILEVHIFRETMGFPEVNARNRLEYVRRAAATLNGQISASERDDWLRTRDHWRWAGESYALATRSEVGYCARSTGECRGRPSATVDAAYLARFAPDVEQRIQAAGVRLADLLNRTLDPAYRAANP